MTKHLDVDFSWQDDAACRHTNQNLWFSPGTGNSSTADQIRDYIRVQTAVTICNDCPVQQPCLAYGKTQHGGIWGGVDFDVNRRLRMVNITQETVVKLATKHRINLEGTPWESSGQ